jgi:HD-GYP domain-containing protein (c-di-GMP phosphodiesterase class II)
MSGQAYVGVPRELIAADVVTGVDLYIHVNGRYVLYRSGSRPVDELSLQKLRRREVGTVYLKSDQVEDFNRYVVSNLEGALKRASSAPQRADMLRRAVQTVLQPNLARLDEPEAYERTRAVSDVTVRNIAEDASVLSGLVRFGEGDERALTRALNVSAYAVALAQQQERFSEDELYSVGVGALVRDAGLARVDGSLDVDGSSADGLLPSDLERNYAGRHSHRGAMMLKQAGVTDQIIFDIVSGHHEWPFNREMPLHVRIVQLADRFDALTNIPGAEQATGPFEALSEMRRRMGGRYSPNLIRDFVMLLGAVQSADGDSPAAALSRRTPAVTPEPAGDEPDDEQRPSLVVPEAAVAV